MRRLGRLAWGLGIASAVLVGAPSRMDAQSSEPLDPAMAQSLFDAGRELMQERRVTEACAKFEESNRLDPSAGTLLNLGKCYEALGRTASAWASYKRAIGVGRSKGQTRQVEAAESFAAELEPKLSKLSLSAEAPVRGLKLYRGETEVAEAARGVAVAVDPGRYEIRATAPGHETFTRWVVIEPGAETMHVEVPALTPRPVDRTPTPPSRPVSGGGPRLDLLVAGSVVGGIGLIGLGVGAGFGAATLADASDARESEALCPGGVCSEAGWQVVQDAETKATISTALLVTGAIATAAGGTLVVLSVVLDPAPTDVVVVPAIGPGFAGVVMGGRL